MADEPRHPEGVVRVGVFRNLHQADDAVRRLHDAGFGKDKLQVVCAKCERTDLADYERKPPSGSAAPKAAAAGGAIGLVLGGLAAAAAVVGTGGAGLLVAGPVIASTAGGGAVAGGYIGAMLSRGVDREATDFYDQALGKGKVLVAADASGPDQEARIAAAERIFREAGAEPIPLHKD
ncbi:MAG TPA: hypothetical protein VEI02_05680 [Planctomycetota bacterium]|nr:hypothetical protein [Planctomycetota bacterium]